MRGESATARAAPASIVRRNIAERARPVPAGDDDLGDNRDGRSRTIMDAGGLFVQLGCGDARQAAMTASVMARKRSSVPMAGGVRAPRGWHVWQDLAGVVPGGVAGPARPAG